MIRLYISRYLGIFSVLVLFVTGVKAQNGIGDNFNNGSLSCGWAPNTYKLTETGNELRVVCTVPGNAYNTFDLNFPSSLNVSSNPVVTIRIKSAVAISVRLDLKDASNTYTNATPIVVAVPGNNIYSTYTFDFTGKFNQSWPTAGTVNAAAVTALNIFVNPGGTAFAGTIYIDDLQLGTGGVLDGGGSSCTIATVAGFTSNIRLNQIGFYPSAPKMAIFKGTPSGSQFNIKTIDLATTVYTGTVSSANTWSFSAESVRIADFSVVTTSGTFVVEVPGVGTSYSFNIANGVHVGVNKAAIKAFYFNRSSTSLDAAYAGAYARAAGHPDNSIIILPSASSGARPAGTILAATKGWYDAGDYNSYIVNSGISTYTLLSSYEQFKSYYDTLDLNIPESGNALPDILDEIKWNLDWMLAMQDPNDGGVYNKKTNANFDPFVMPSAATTARYFCAKGTAATFDFAAVMAVAYRLYLPFDATFANTCLNAAVAAYNWGVANPNIPFNNPGASGSYPAVTTGGYGDTNLGDEYEWAASELYIATLNNTYYTKSFKNANTYGIPDWSNVRTLGLLSLIKNRKNLTSAAFSDTTNMKSKLTSLANPYSTYQQSSAYRVPMGTGGNGDFAWGSNAVAANQGMILLHAYRMTNNVQYYNAALAQLDYLLGRNPTTYCFITGQGKNRVMHPHHRVSEADGIMDPVPGWLAGGPQNGATGDGCANDPNPALAYVDAQPCYTKNEIAINWNAPFVFLSSGLEVLNPFSQPSTNNPPHAAGTISGLSTVCQGASYIYSIATVSGATSYNWSAPSGATITGQGTNAINVKFSSVSGPVAVLPINSFGTGTGYSLLVNVNALPAATGTITGPTSACANQSGLVFSVSTVLGGNSLNWTVPSGSSILQGNGTNTVTVNLGALGGNISVNPINGCGTGTGSSLSISINTVPASSGTISGLSTVCASQTGQVYSISSVSGAISYNWSASGATISSGNGSNSITVAFNTSNALISVKPLNSCGTGAGSNLSIQIQAYSVAGISISGSATSVCSGTSINFTSTVTNSGNLPSINWYRNSISVGSGATYSYIPSNADNIQAVLIPNGTGLLCLTNNSATSAGINLTVTPLTNSSITINASQTTVCSGSIVTFTASGTNGGSAPTYQWFRNGASQGTGSIYSYTPSNGDVVKAVMSAGGSGTACIQGSPVTSTGISLTVNGTLTSGVTINASQTNICSGSTVTFTASGTNGGSAPSYQWFRNGLAQGTGSIYSYTPSNGDVVKAVMSAGGSGTTCIQGSPVTSTGISLTVNSTLTSGVTINSSQTTVCSGSIVTFTASGTNGGSAPTYQWFRNGASQGTGSIYSYAPSNGDVVKAVMSAGGSGTACIQGSPVTSTGISLTVNGTLTSGIMINASQTTVCSGSTVTFTASGTNGGSAPTYQWFRNGASQGTGSIYSYTPSNGDVVKAMMSAGGTGTACIIGSPVTSNGISLTVNSNITPSIAINSSQISACTGTSITFTLTGTNTGTSPLYQWMINGTNQLGANKTTFSGSNFTNGTKISASVVSNANCANPSTVISNTITLTSIPNGTSPCLAPAIGSITGATVANQNQVGLVFSVISLAGTSYSWSVPSGATITSGVGTNSITVTFGNTGGNVDVVATNSYGATTSSITVNILPTDLSVSKQEMGILVFPNPSSNQFLLKVRKGHSNSISLRLFDVNGNEILNVSEINQSEYIFGESLPSGVYLLTVSDGANTLHFKIVKIQ